MGFFDRLSRVLRANLNDLVSKAEDPAKILDQSVADMQADLIKLRQAVATAIASQKRIQNQADQAEAQARTWYERAELALKKGEEELEKAAEAATSSEKAAGEKRKEPEAVAEAVGNLETAAAEPACKVAKHD